MSAIYEAAEVAYRALCRVEDELDALGRDLGEAEANALRRLGLRWIDDTDRKIKRALNAPPCERSTT